MQMQSSLELHGRIRVCCTLQTAPALTISPCRAHWLARHRLASQVAGQLSCQVSCQLPMDTAHRHALAHIPRQGWRAGRRGQERPDAGPRANGSRVHMANRVSSKRGVDRCTVQLGPYGPRPRGPDLELCHSMALLHLWWWWHPFVTHKRIDERISPSPSPIPMPTAIHHVVKVKVVLVPAQTGLGSLPPPLGRHDCRHDAEDYNKKSTAHAHAHAQPNLQGPAAVQRCGL